jgi:hypothetical protein
MLTHTARLSAFLAVFASTAHAQQTVLLRLAPPAGQVSRYRIEAETTVEAAGMGQFSATQLMVMSQTVVSVDGDERKVDMVLDSVVLDGPAAQAMGEAAEALDGLRTRLRMDTRGRVLESSLVAPEDNPVIERMSAVLERAMPAAVLLPEAPVEPGASWSDTNTVTFPAAMGSMVVTRNLRYRLERVELQGEVRHAIISVNGTIVQTVTAAQGDGVAMESTGTVQGEMDIDLDAGRWVLNEIAMAMVAEGPMLPGPMTTQVVVRGALTAR